MCGAGGSILKALKRGYQLKMIAKRVSLSRTFRCLAVVMGLVVAVTASLFVKSQADDDPIVPQAILNIDLATPGTSNVQVIGAAAEDHLTGNGLPNTFTDLRRSRALAVGDFNADGIQDLVIGSADASPVVGMAPARVGAGAVYIIFGRTTTFLPVFDTKTNNPSITIVGALAGDALGFSVAVGDVNGDTFDDLVIGAPGVDFPGVAATTRATPIPNTGAVYVFLGGATQTPRTIDLLTANAADVVIYGIASDDLFGDALAVGNAGGNSASSGAEQLIKDVLVGAPGNKGPVPASPRLDGGAAFLVFGRTTLGKVAAATLVIDLGNVGTPANVIVYGLAGDMLGSTIAIADLDATSPGDLVVGAPGSERPALGPVLAADNTGATYSFFGGTNLNPLAGLSRTFDVSLPTVNQRPSVSIYGRDADDHSGAALAVGDVTGDGVSDLIIGAPDADGPGTTVRTNSGEAYVIAGSTTLTPDTSQVERRIDIILPGTFLKLTVFGNAAQDHLGSSVATGSFNVTGNIDSVPDLILGSPGASSNKGSVSILFGGPALTLLATRDLNIGQDDVRVTGEAAGDELGWGLATADLDRNRGGDLILGAPYAEVVSPDARTNAGKVYFILAATDVVPPPNQPPTVQVSAPNGAENALGGSFFSINWTATDPNGDGTIQRFEIRLSTDSGGTFNTIVADALAGAARTFSWTVPRINSTTARMRVTAFDSGGLQGQDDSNADFTITDPGVPVHLLTPNGGDGLKFGQTSQITWEVPLASAPQVLGFDIFLSTNSGATFDIAIQNDPITPKLGPAIRTFAWTVPSNICTETARVLVRATSVIGSRSLDSSDTNFSMTAPGPTVDKNDMSIDNSAIDLRAIQPAVGDEVRFADDVQVQVSDATGIAFFEFKKLKIKKSGRKLLSKGSINGVDLGTFFPDGATRNIRITNPPCGITFLRVRRQGEVLVVATAAELLQP
jgi:hypothetical protein